MRRATLALSLLFACNSNKTNDLLHVASPVWEDQVVYFVMTDRFANGDRANDDQHLGEFDPANKDKYSGGDLQGVIDKLDYIQGLGATAVWITPPVANMWWDPLQQSGGFHGYWARDLKKVDEHLGTLETYQSLSRELHRRGMYLIQDVVPNHMGNFFQYSSYDPNDVSKGFVKNTQAVPTARPGQAPFDQDDATDPAQRAAAIYHWTPAISDYSNPVQEASYQVSDLDDLNTENPVVRKALRDSYAYWIKQVGVDAFRVDTAKFVPHAFWNDFFHSTDAEAPGILAAARATGRDRFFAFGEVFELPDPLDDAADRKVASFLGSAATPELPAVLGFPLYGEIGRVFAEGAPTSYMTYRLAKATDPALFPNPAATPTFIDNHDVRRFLSVASGDALQQALAFLFTVPGIPIVYYGTEQAFTETRAAMFKGGYLSDKDHYDTAAPLYLYLKDLIAMRKKSVALRQGTVEVVYDNEAGPGAFAFRRSGGGETMLVLLNSADERVLVSGLDSKLPGGSVLETTQSFQSPPDPRIDAAGKLQMVLPPRAVLIARATGQTSPPPPPSASITVGTNVDGATLSADTTLSGTVTPVTTRLQLVVDGYLSTATEVPVAADGSWSIALPVSSFPTGTERHAAAIYAPDAKVATPQMRFTSNVVFSGTTLETPDPAGDDAGSSQAYRYPQDSTFHHQQDITGVKLEIGATTLRMSIALADFSTVWAPPNGYDHVAFNIYFEVPGQTGATVMPMLQASVPNGFTWMFNQFSYGWSNVMYTSSGATATRYGTTVAAAPKVHASPTAKTVVFTYDRTKFGLATWSGVRIYVTAWDFDGIGASFRAISQDGGQWTYGGAAPTSPMIMDDVAPIAIP